MPDAPEKDETPGTNAVDFAASSPDGREVQGLHTRSEIEQSIQAALGPLAFAPNNEDTWATAVGTVTKLLEDLWAEGSLAGATASEAFTIQCGLGRTMTPQDILEGYMFVQVALQMLRPAEFIELTIKQRMQGS